MKLQINHQASMASAILSLAKPSPLQVQPNGKHFAEFSALPKPSASLPFGRKTSNDQQMMKSKVVASQRNIACFALQESSTSTADAADTSTKEVKTADQKAAAPAKPKVAAKAPMKALPQMMVEDVIPPLKAILETQDELSDIELCFQDNRLEGSFIKKGNFYSFWAFFPSGVLTGPKGFSLSSYGSGVSTVEPFLIDEKKITAKHIVFWVEKRLAAQGIIPVWN
ncbi:uncharacterized protein LOC103956060 isoform X1 [Pyrus x bretschneideri]|uniref:uncharacterized protein LOC103956060 isoform X1 n=1 Tax=Pyrus x bretschneideri TaxID=225117 RepID=UPI00202F1EED|nr:uncharacterized protein LOC103956060 isoform X1 [Pyrus x bretschneideri]